MQLNVPGHLKPAGAALWSSLVTEYGIQDAGGLALVTAACECLDRLREAQEQLDSEGTVLTDRYGGKKAHPSVAIEKDSRNGMLAALKALNLDVEPLRDRPGNPGLQGSRRTA